MNPVAARTEVARALAAGYAADPAVLGVLCAGSTGRGEADRWSDLELLVVWAAEPLPEQRRVAPDRAGGDHLRQFDRDPGGYATGDDYWIGGPAGTGLLVEAGHLTAADATAALDRLLVDADPDPDLLALAAAFGGGVPVHGDLSRWRDRVAAYPPRLAAAAIRRHGQIDHFWRWRMYVDRHDVHGLRTHNARVAGAVLHMACALSGVFWPGPKWAVPLAARLPVAPVDLADRLRRVDTLAPDAAASALTDLVEETYDLVEVRTPEVDVARLRQVFRFARSPWPPAPVAADGRPDQGGDAR